MPQIRPSPKFSASVPLYQQMPPPPGGVPGGGSGGGGFYHRDSAVRASDRKLYCAVLLEADYQRAIGQIDSLDSAANATSKLRQVVR